MKIESIRIPRGKVLIRRDKWKRKFESSVLDLEIPQEYQLQTWRGEVIAVGPAPWLTRSISDGNDSRGIPRFRERIKTRNGQPLTVGQEIRKGDFLTFPWGCPGSCEFFVGDDSEGELTRDTAEELWMIAPVEQVIFAERPEA